MITSKTNISGFFKSLSKNIFSGFVVSLIALPLGLGLAMASDAPPIAGVVTAIIGGTIVALLGGSYVTITGPGNGLVGVLLVAITALGLEGAYAAIICSGILMVILGFLRMGKLADYFPSSAIQGMLAAIGLIILGKQFHIMLGNRISRENSFEYLLEIPNTIIALFSFNDKGLIYAAIVGIVSLLIMVYYPKIRNKYLQLIPAPMWIVLLAIGLSYYYELVLKQPNPIHPDYMISGIPNFNQLVSEIPVPDFNLIGSTAFWSSVVALTFIASIESLLSIKAVDKLDPEKRRSNVNKDIKALGLATVGSGFLGGLNVVIVIARSSVNVNNGATNRSANFSHAVFLVAFIALFSTQLTRIPLPSLMAILVFTGYKLASPDIVRRIFKVGREQLIIFFVTLFITLQIGLITGILAGVVATFLIHIFLNKSFAFFLRNILKPNVLMFKEDETGTYYVSIKHFCSFLNFNRFKEKIDVIPETSKVIVDFSSCEFVDHTAMEGINNYQELFLKRGGVFEVIGLDLHGADSEHPFALRKIIPIQNILPNTLTKRQKNLDSLAKDYDLFYESKKLTNIHALDNFLFFKTKKVENIYNQIFNQKNSFKVFDITFSEGEFIAKEVVRTTMLYMELPKQIPVFSLDKEGLLEKVYALSGFTDIKIDAHPDFSNRFYIKGEDENSIKAFFIKDVVHFFESNPYYHVESNGDHLLVFSKQRLASISEIKALVDFGKRLQQVIIDCIK